MSVVDDLLVIIEEEVRRERFDPMRLPRAKSSMCRIMDLFKVPAPYIVSVPMERTTWQIRHDVQPRRPSFPVFNFLEQLQDLLNEDVFGDVSNLCVNADELRPLCAYRQ